MSQPAVLTPEQIGAIVDEGLKNPASASSGGAGGRDDIRKLVRDTATEYGIDPDIFEAQIRQESGFNPRNYTKNVLGGAYGLGQLTESEIRRFRLTDRYDPHQNIRATAQLMKSYLDRTGYNYDQALLLHHSGKTHIGPGEKNGQLYIKTILGHKYGEPPTIRPPGGQAPVDGALTPEQIIAIVDGDDLTSGRVELYGQQNQKMGGATPQLSPGVSEPAQNDLHFGPQDMRSTPRPRLSVDTKAGAESIESLRKRKETLAKRIASIDKKIGTASDLKPVSVPVGGAAAALISSAAGIALASASPAKAETRSLLRMRSFLQTKMDGIQKKIDTATVRTGAGTGGAGIAGYNAGWFDRPTQEEATAVATAEAEAQSALAKEQAAYDDVVKIYTQRGMVAPAKPKSLVDAENKFRKASASVQKTRGKGRPKEGFLTADQQRIRQQGRIDTEDEIGLSKSFFENLIQSNSEGRGYVSGDLPPGVDPSELQGSLRTPRTPENIKQWGAGIGPGSEFEGLLQEDIAARPENRILRSTVNFLSVVPGANAIVGLYYLGQTPALVSAIAADPEGAGREYVGALTLRKGFDDPSNPLAWLEGVSDVVANGALVYHIAKGMVGPVKGKQFADAVNAEATRIEAEAMAAHQADRGSGPPPVVTAAKSTSPAPDVTVAKPTVESKGAKVFETRRAADTQDGSGVFYRGRTEGTPDNSASVGTWGATDKHTASNYGSSLSEFSLRPDAKVITADTKIELMQKVLGISDSVAGDLSLAKSDAEYAAIALKAIGKEPTGDFLADTKLLDTALVSAMRKSGVDAALLYNTGNDFGTEVVVANREALSSLSKGAPSSTEPRPTSRDTTSKVSQEGGETPPASTSLAEPASAQERGPNGERFSVITRQGKRIWFADESKARSVARTNPGTTFSASPEHVPTTAERLEMAQKAFEEAKASGDPALIAAAGDAVKDAYDRYVGEVVPVKRGRGRPKGAKNKVKTPDEHIADGDSEAAKTVTPQEKGEAGVDQPSLGPLADIGLEPPATSAELKPGNKKGIASRRRRQAGFARVGVNRKAAGEALEKYSDNLKGLAAAVPHVLDNAWTRLNRFGDVGHDIATRIWSVNDDAQKTTAAHVAALNSVLTKSIGIMKKSGENWKEALGLEGDPTKSLLWRRAHGQMSGMTHGEHLANAVLTDIFRDLKLSADSAGVLVERVVGKGLETHNLIGVDVHYYDGGHKSSPMVRYLRSEGSGGLYEGGMDGIELADGTVLLNGTRYWTKILRNEAQFAPVWLKESWLGDAAREGSPTRSKWVKYVMEKTGMTEYGAETEVNRMIHGETFGEPGIGELLEGEQIPSAYKSRLHFSARGDLLAPPEAWELNVGKVVKNAILSEGMDIAWAKEFGGASERLAQSLHGLHQDAAEGIRDVIKVITGHSASESGRLSGLQKLNAFDQKVTLLTKLSGVLSMLRQLPSPIVNVYTEFGARGLYEGGKGTLEAWFRDAPSYKDLRDAGVLDADVLDKLGMSGMEGHWGAVANVAVFGLKAMDEVMRLYSVRAAFGMLAPTLKNVRVINVEGGIPKGVRVEGSPVLKTATGEIMLVNNPAYRLLRNRYKFSDPDIVRMLGGDLTLKDVLRVQNAGSELQIRARRIETPLMVEALGPVGRMFWRLKQFSYGQAEIFLGTVSELRQGNPWPMIRWLGASLIAGEAATDLLIEPVKKFLLGKDSDRDKNWDKIVEAMKNGDGFGAAEAIFARGLDNILQVGSLGMLEAIPRIGRGEDVGRITGNLTAPVSAQSVLGLMDSLRWSFGRAWDKANNSNEEARFRQDFLKIYSEMQQDVALDFLTRQVVPAGQAFSGVTRGKTYRQYMGEDGSGREKAAKAEKSESREKRK